MGPMTTTTSSPSRTTRVDDDVEVEPDEDAFSEDDDTLLALEADDDDDVVVDDVVDEEEAEDEEDDAAAARKKRRKTTAAADEEEDDDDEDLVSPDDVEADLDRILKDRMVTVEEDDEDDEEADEPEERGEAGDRLQPKRADETLCGELLPARASQRTGLSGRGRQLPDLHVIDPDVRTAEPADVAQLAALEAEARHALVDQRGGARWLEEHPLIGERWPERLASDTVFVAFIDDVLVGYAVVVDDSRRHQPRRSGLRDAGARELGFGDALLAAGAGACP